MIRLITFDSGNFSKSASILDASARKFGAGDVAIYQPKDLDGHFMATTILPMVEGSRGFGWWVWKPYIILGHMMVACKEGDVLIYSDAGQEIVGNLNHIIDSMGADPDNMNDNIMLFTNGFQHSHWCKAEVAGEINGFSEYVTSTIIYKSDKDMWERYYKHKQVQASFIIFKVNQKTIDFVKEWYTYSIMPGMIDNIPRGTQFPEFAEHRHDQAILTCLAIKYGIKQHWFPSTTNMHQQTQEQYGVTILHHRKRDNEW